MPRLITLLIAVIFSATISAQNDNEKKEIKNTIETFFVGLQKGDSTILKNTLQTNQVIFGK